MAKQKPTIPKGTRDFPPSVMIKRKYIFDAIEDVFRRYAYQPLETPSMENLSTLMGKYGEEGDQLLFRILDSGDFFKGEASSILEEKGPSNSAALSAALRNQIAQKGLRYDLTVPFARFVVQHRNDITFPFKRYQIQPVWRADKPQKGRYREFYQCDGDVIGTDSLLNELELIQIIDDVFTRLGLDVTIKINNRKILKGLADHIEQPDKFMDLTMAIDKLDKIGQEGVKKEMQQRGIHGDAVEKLTPFLTLEGDNSQKLDRLSEMAGQGEGRKGIEETRELLDYVGSLNLNNTLEFDPRLARGLDYYTGTIFEVKTNEMQIGSICGGGRYDDLTSVFGLNDVSGVGISFGAERIYDVMEKLDRFPRQLQPAARIMFVNFGKKETIKALEVLQELRNANIESEIYPDPAKMKKQMSYADSKSIAYVGMIGEDEMARNMITVKNMATGEQKQMDVQELKVLLING
jgi:histidyl-tRNA synthetase